MNPFLATALGTVAGAAAGLLTAVLSVRLKIMSLLAGILTMVALYPINLRVMGRPNISLFGYVMVFSPVQALFGGSIWSNAVMLAAIAIVAKLLLDGSLRPRSGWRCGRAARTLPCRPPMRSTTIAWLSSAWC